MTKDSVIENRSSKITELGKIKASRSFIGTDQRHLPLTSETTFRSLVPYDSTPFVVSEPDRFFDFSRRVIGIWSGVIFTKKENSISIDYQPKDDPNSRVKFLSFSTDLNPYCPRVNRQISQSLVCLFPQPKPDDQGVKARSVAITSFADAKTQIYKMPDSLPHLQQAEFLDDKSLVLLASDGPFYKGNRFDGEPISAKGELYRFDLQTSALTHLRSLSIRSRSGWMAVVGDKLMVLGINGIVKVDLKS
jgi:hypothetical protein